MLHADMDASVYYMDSIFWADFQTLLIYFDEQDGSTRVAPLLRWWTLLYQYIFASNDSLFDGMMDATTAHDHGNAQLAHFALTLLFAGARCSKWSFGVFICMLHRRHTSRFRGHFARWCRAPS